MKKLLAFATMLCLLLGCAAAEEACGIGEAALVVVERTPDERTCQICDYIRQSPLIKCVLSGHTHVNTEILGLDGQDQLITGCSTIREITVI